MQVKNIGIRMLCLAVLCVSAIALNAQRAMKLNDCMELGLKNSEAVLQQQLNIEIASNAVERSKSSLMPQLNAMVDLRDNTQLQTNIVPAGVFGSESKAVQFGTTYNFIAGFGLTQNVFDNTIISDRDIATARVRTREEELRLLRTSVKLSIAKAYYDVVLKRQVLALADAALARSKEVYAEAEVKNRQGTMLDADRSRAMLESSNAQAARDLASDALELSMLALKRSMGMGIEESMDVADDVNSLMASSESLSPALGTVSDRPEYTLEQAQQKVNQLQVAKFEKAWLPSVQLYANFSANYLSNDLGEMARNQWHPFSYIGAKVNVPLFDGFARTRAAQEYRLGLKVNQVNLQRIEQDFHYENAAANQSLRNAKRSLQNAQAARLLAEEILVIDRKRYALGTILQSELSRSEQLLKDAESNLVQCLYNVLLADLKLKQAAGML